MYKRILDIIKAYDSIIITRHSRPDMDALGSSFGLKEIIKENFPNKKVYMVGDLNRFCPFGEMDDINEKIYKKSLLIFTDVCVTNLLPDIPYDKALKIISIDHHKNDTNIPGCEAFYDKEAAAAAQIIATLAFENNLKLNENAKNALFSGIISDTNRFNFSLSKALFETTGKLIEQGLDYSSLYNKMYEDDLSYIQMKAYFTLNIIKEDIGLAYLKNDASIFNKFNVDTFTISRGMVNVMSNLKGVEIWANFTQDKDSNKILCEFRSKRIIILEIAIKYGGGGHPLACGATVESFEVVEEILNDFRNLLKG